MVSLFVSHIRPIIDYGSCLWNVGYLRDVRRLESLQRRWTREIEGLGGLSYVSRLKEVGLYSVCGRLLRLDVVKIWKSFFRMWAFQRCLKWRGPSVPGDTLLRCQFR